MCFIVLFLFWFTKHFSNRNMIDSSLAREIEFPSPQRADDRFYIVATITSHLTKHGRPQITLQKSSSSWEVSQPQRRNDEDHVDSSVVYLFFSPFFHPQQSNLRFTRLLASFLFSLFFPLDSLSNSLDVFGIGTGVYR